MASSVYYKFKAQKDESRVAFDGTGISVFDLKREIIVANKMGSGTEFDLALYDSASNREYLDDDEVIPRSSSVVVRRLPPSKPGKGKAQLYVSAATPVKGANDVWSEVAQDKSFGPSPAWKPGYGSISQRFDGKDISALKQKGLQGLPASKGNVDMADKPPSIPETTMSQEEQAAIAEMFQTTSEQWQKTQEKMSQATPVYGSRGRGGPRKPHQQHQAYEQAQRPPPLGYTCYRCGQKGHWIHDCPTNGDQEFDNRPRIKRTTGIPRSFLKPVDNPIATGSSTQGVMVTPDGGYVVAQPDSAAWEKQRAKVKTLTEADIRERPCSDPSLTCPLCSKLLREAVKTPCCSTTYCEECIQAYLLEHDFLCPNCGKKIGSLDKLEPDRETRANVKQYIFEAVEQDREEAPETTAAIEIPNESQGEAQELSSESVVPSANISSQVSALHEETKQMHALLSNPNMTQQDRQRLQVRLQQTLNQIAQLQMFATMSDMNGGSFGGTMDSMTGFSGAETLALNGMMGGGMVNGVPLGGFDPSYMGGPGWSQGEFGMDWSGFNAGIDQPGSHASTRRNLKRPRPQDFVEVDSGGKYKTNRPH